MVYLTRREALLITLAAGVADANATSGPPLWVVERGRQKVFLFGQAPVPSGSNWFSPTIRHSFDSSAELWVENPEFDPAEIRAAMARRPKGPTLKEAASATDGAANVIPEATLKARAKAAAKPIHSEWKSFDEIERFQTDLPEETRRRVQLELFGKELDEAEDIEGVEHRLTQWLAGNLDGLNELDRQIQQRYPTIYQHVGADRNKAWVPRIESILARQQVAFICVGVLHVIGPESIQAHLIRSGFSVRRV